MTAESDRGWLAILGAIVLVIGAGLIEGARRLVRNPGHLKSASWGPDESLGETECPFVDCDKVATREYVVAQESQIRPTYYRYCKEHAPMGIPPTRISDK